MKNSRTLIFRSLWAGLTLSVLIPPALAQTVTQTITLQPGWNAVWLEVQPANNAASAVFSNLPVTSVWSRAERLSSVDFIQNPSEQAFNESGWLAWLPAWRTESFLNNLFAVHANRAYLLRCTNTAPVVWSIAGRPSLRHLDWVPDAFNLRGLPVDPISPPTFLNFFRHSPAHYNAANAQLQKIYRLNSAAGQWQPVAPADAVQSGAAYWIYTRGASDYLAPLIAEVELGDGLDFGVELTELNLRLRNFTTAPANALLRDLNSPASSILSYYQFNAALGAQWPALPNPLAVSVANGLESRVRLAARRQNLSGSSYSSVLEVRNGAGTRLLVPMSVERFTGTASRPEQGSGAGATDPLAGLWVGIARLNAVSEPHSASPTNRTPVRFQFNLRLIVHVDASGQARLLKEVLQMWREGTVTNDGSGNFVAEKPGEYVLLTDDSLISMFGGAAVRDGVSVGRRLSSIGYDFPSTTTSNFLTLTGTFAIGDSLSGTLTMPPDHPTNPFKHKFHPDHDNLNARFDGPTLEAYSATRQVRLDFLASPPDGPAVPDFGYNEMGGTYRETISGIHKNAIYVSGTFRLRRASLIAQLNPNPQP
jgi:hypothetical protein